MTNTAQVLIFFCLTLVSLSLSERVHFDQCPRNIQPKQGLDISKLEGSWIMYAKYGHTLKGEIARCSRVEFGKQDRGEIHMFEEHIYSRWKTTKEIKLVYETEGKYDLETLSKKDFEMSFEEKQIREYYRKQRKISTFYILDTDYECWVITYRCKEKKETPQIKYSVISSALLLKNTNDCVKEQTKSNYESVLNQVGVQAPHLTWLRVDGC